MSFAGLGYKIDFAIDDACRFAARKGRDFRTSAKALKSAIAFIPTAYKAAKYDAETDTEIVVPVLNPEI